LGNGANRKAKRKEKKDGLEKKKKASMRAEGRCCGLKK